MINSNTVFALFMIFQGVASKARQRANDLKNMIELDTVFYDLFDLPPVREYDLYIRSFGRSNTKQVRKNKLRNLKIEK